MHLRATNAVRLAPEALCGYRAEMRWDDVFADLEAAAAGLRQQERDSEIADRTRAELATVALADRFRAAVGRSATVRVTGLGVVSGRVERVAPRWLLLAAADEVEWLVAWPAVLGVSGLSAQAVDQAPGHVESALGWPATWRVLARDRGPVQVARLDASMVTGIPDRVGADFVELGLRDPDDASTRTPSSTVELVPYAAVAAVRCPRLPAG